jgi:hypothetical protein
MLTILLDHTEPIMRKTLTLLILVLAFLSSATQSAHAQTSERILIPIVVSFVPIPGAHGSLWTSELVARNLGSAAVQVSEIWPLCPPIGASCGTVGWIAPNETALLRPEGGTPDRPAAIIQALSADSLAFHLRVQDLSRQAETWGTEVPVVRERDLRTQTFALVNVPVTDGFRNTLRIYDIDGRSEADVRVRVFRVTLQHAAGPGESSTPDQLLGDRILRLTPPVSAWRDPGYLEIGDLNEIASLGDAERVTIEIEPVSPGLRIWAIVSVTNNATQHVTTVTPQ